MKFPWQKKSAADAILGALSILGAVLVASVSETPEQRADRLERELERERRKARQARLDAELARAQAESLDFAVRLQKEVERRRRADDAWRDEMARRRTGVW